MNINIKSTGLEITTAIREYTEKRLSGLDRFLAGDSTAQCTVELGRTTAHHKNGDIFRAEVHIVANHKDIYVESEKSDLYAAIDEVKDEVFNRLASSKDKKVSLARRGGARVKNAIKGLFGRE